MAGPELRSTAETDAGGPIHDLHLTPSRRDLGFLGLGSVAAILVGALVAAIEYRGYAGEPYSPLNHFVSELGEIAASRFAWAFNLGVVAGGAGLGGFLLMVSRLMSGRFRAAFAVVSALAGVAGILCGVFPMDYLATHRLVSAAFFLTGWLVAATFTAWLVTHRPVQFPSWLALPGAVVIVVFLAFIAIYASYRPVDPNAHILVRPEVWDVPALEWASLISLLAWLACVSISLIRGGIRR